MQSWIKIFTQDSNNPLIEHIIYTIDHRMTIAIVVVTATFFSLISTLLQKTFNRFFSENTEIEIFWTITPAFLLWFVGIPSVKMLFISEDILFPLLTFKAIGHQWYWTYEYTDLKAIQFDSFLIEQRKIRLLESDNHLIIPFKTAIRALVSSEDVIHSWAIPRIALKADAIPGRINQISIFINRPGILTGQCSELCGAGHSFMPIIVSSISTKNFEERFKQLNLIFFSKMLLKHWPLKSKKILS
jgi:cytochrome c oxidase subunit 2